MNFDPALAGRAARVAEEAVARVVLELLRRLLQARERAVDSARRLGHLEAQTG